MAHQSFAKNVVDALQEEANKRGEGVSAGKLSSLLFLQTRLEHKRLLNTLSDLAGRGKIVRISQGVYAPATGIATADKRDVMWRLLRMRRTVTVADLQEMAGVSPHYAKEWLELLVRRGMALLVAPPKPNQPHSWRLISDQVEPPINDEKAAKQRELRKKKKNAITGKLDVISTALADVRQLLNNMEEGQ